MANSIAGELLSNINTIPFKQIIPALHNNSGISEVMFSRTTLAKQFILDTHHWIDGIYMNPNTMFEFFGLYSNDMSKQVCKAMIKYLGLNTKQEAQGFYAELFSFFVYFKCCSEFLAELL